MVNTFTIEYLIIPHLCFGGWERNLVQAIFSHPRLYTYT